jgi:hypothetical protein
MFVICRNDQTQFFFRKYDDERILFAELIYVLLQKQPFDLSENVMKWEVVCQKVIIRCVHKLD